MASSLLLGWGSRIASPRGIGFLPVDAPSEGGDSMQLIEDDSESHAVILSGTGTGKGRSFAIPNLVAFDGGMVVVDPKGELCAVTSRHRSKLGPVAVIDPFGIVKRGADGFNPLAAIHPDDPAFIDDVVGLTSMFATELTSVKDGDFWSSWATDVISAMAVHVLATGSETDRSLGRVYRLLNTGDHYDDLSRMLAEEVRHSYAHATLSKYVALPDITRGGILSTVAQQIRLLASDGVQDSLATNTIDLASIRNGDPFTIYLVMPPGKLKSHAALIRVYLTGIVQLLMSRRRRPRRPTLLLVDEAGQIGNMPTLVAATTLGRGYGIRIAWIFQSPGQLRASYPQEHETILDNCANVMTFGPVLKPRIASELTEKVFGDVATNALLQLGSNEVVIARAGQPTIIGRKLDYLRDEMFAGRFDSNPLHWPPPLRLVHCPPPGEDRPSV